MLASMPDRAGQRPDSDGIAGAFAALGGVGSRLRQDFPAISRTGAEPSASARAGRVHGRGAFAGGVGPDQTAYRWRGGGAGRAAAPSGDGMTPISASGSLFGPAADTPRVDPAAAAGARPVSLSRAWSMMMFASPTSNSISASPNRPTCKRCAACARDSRGVGGPRCCDCAGGTGADDIGTPELGAGGGAVIAGLSGAAGRKRKDFSIPAPLTPARERAAGLSLRARRGCTASRDSENRYRTGSSPHADEQCRARTDIGPAPPPRRC